MTTPQSKTLAVMTAEVVDNNTQHGWYENVVTFPEAMALLHSEVAESTDAWRRWGIDDATNTLISPAVDPGNLPKPEGVGSEFADVFIRLMDDAWLFGKIDLEAAAASPGQFGINMSFLTNMNTLHVMIARLSLVEETAFMDVTGEQDVAKAFGDILKFLRQLCGYYDIDLTWEYERKMAFNRTRPYRHGNKRK
jgi:NTP pyrophosphatase (non-canonical NTP hydrolase)